MSMTDVHIRDLIGRAADYCLDLGPHLAGMSVAEIAAAYNGIGAGWMPAAIRAINTSVSNLAHDFGERMNSLDKRIIVEKEKWGETLRWVVKVAVKVILAGAAVAMGVTAIQNFFK